VSTEDILEEISVLETKRSLREKIAFYLEDTDTNVGLVFNLGVLSLILLSSAIFVLGTYPIATKYNNAFALSVSFAGLGFFVL